MSLTSAGIWINSKEYDNGCFCESISNFYIVTKIPVRVTYKKKFLLWLKVAEGLFSCPQHTHTHTHTHTPTHTYLLVPSDWTEHHGGQGSEGRAYNRGGRLGTRLQKPPKAHLPTPVTASLSQPHLLKCPSLFQLEARCSSHKPICRISYPNHNN